MVALLEVGVQLLIAVVMGTCVGTEGIGGIGGGVVARFNIFYNMHIFIIDSRTVIKKRD